MAGTTVKIELNYAGIGKLLKDPAIQRMLGDIAAHIAAAAGPGFESSSTIGRNRALAMAWAETYEAMRAEAKDRALSRAFASRGFGGG